MAKAAINQTIKLNAQGCLGIEGNILVIENPDTGELIDLRVLFEDFLDRPIKLSVSYDYDYDDQGVQNE